MNFSSNMKQLWQYRGFVISSVQRDFKTKYSQSTLGALWGVINPLVIVIVYTAIFTQIMSARLPGVDDSLAYGIYLCSGIFAWGLFTEIASRSHVVFIENATLIKKLHFPILCLPLIVILTALINFSIVMGLFLAALIITDHTPSYNLLTLLPMTLVLALFASGLGMTVGILNVFFRDVGQLFTVALSLLFWGTPIIYPINILPSSVAGLIQLNPLTSIMASFQQLFVNGATPKFTDLIYCSVLGATFITTACILYRLHGHEIVDEI